MKITDIITTIFEYKHFDTIIISISIFLVLLFIIVLIVGLLDSRKKKEKPVELFEKEEITFEAPKEELIINEEITLEMPSITKNLEDFKKSIEEEIKQENITSNIEVEQSNEKPLLDNSKPIKILNINEIENTQIVETIKEEKVETAIEEYYEEIEILDENFDEPVIAELQEEAIIEVQKLDIPLLAPDEDDEMLFKTMTALRIPQDV
jgi:hypothetical protein